MNEEEEEPWFIDTGIDGSAYEDNTGNARAGWGIGVCGWNDCVLGLCGKSHSSVIMNQAQVTVDATPIKVQMSSLRSDVWTYEVSMDVSASAPAVMYFVFFRGPPPTSDLH